MTLTHAIAYSPITTLSANFNEAATTASVVEILAFPSTPFYAVLTSKDNIGYQSNDPDDYETILVEGIDGGNLTSITRGVEGTDQDWVTGDFIACFWTAEAYKDFKEGIEGKVTKAGDTMSGTLNMNENIVDKAEFKNYVETLVTSSGTGAQTLNLANGNIFKHTVNSNNTTTFSLSNVRNECHSFTLALDQHSDEPSIVWNFTVEWAEDDPPEILEGRNHLVFHRIVDSEDWYGHLVGQNYGSGS